MRHLVKHVTRYRYAAPVSYSIQTLRLTPRLDDHQRALRWHIQAPGDIQAQVDAYGNVAHTLILNRRHHEVEIQVTGQVEIEPRAQGHVGQEDHRLPVHVYCVPTALTHGDDAVRGFSGRVLPRGLSTPEDALSLAEAICDRVVYAPDDETAGGEPSGAAQVLALGRGGSRDQAHLFLACARACGTPARYVSGYLYTQDDQAVAHAWADIWLPEPGWVSVDVTHRRFASDRHCRLAVARDHDSASPVRWLHGQGADMSTQISVTMQAGA